MGSNPAALLGETSVNRRQGSTTHRQLVALLIAGAAIFGLSGCSPGVDYPSIFSTDHDPPPPAATMNTDQVQQATEALITDRDHLNAQAQGAAGQDQSKDNSQNPASSSAKAAAAKKKPARETEAAAGAAPASAATGAQTAGAESK